MGPHPCGRAVSKGVIFVSCLRLSSNCVSLSLCLSSVSAAGSQAPVSVSVPLSLCRCVATRTGLAHPSPVLSPSRGFPVLVLLQPEGRTYSQTAVGKATGTPLLSFEASSPTPVPRVSRTPRPATTGEGTRAPWPPPPSSPPAPQTGQGVRPGQGEVEALTRRGLCFPLGWDPRPLAPQGAPCPSS